MENKRKVGSLYETRACEFLEKNDFHIIDRNFRNRFGEIDIIGYDGSVLVFLEVKYRKRFTAGTAEAAVDFKKQQIICSVADYYRMIHHVDSFTMMRYDVIAMDDSDIRWIKNAFQHIFCKVRRR